MRSQGTLYLLETQGSPTAMKPSRFPRCSLPIRVKSPGIATESSRCHISSNVSGWPMCPGTQEGPMRSLQVAVAALPTFRSGGSQGRGQLIVLIGAPCIGFAWVTLPEYSKGRSYGQVRTLTVDVILIGGQRDGAQSC